MNHYGAGGEAVRKTVNILGTEYKIEIHKKQDDKLLEERSWVGYCSSDLHLIVIADFDDTDSFYFASETEKDICAKRTLRHELVHAFLNESGLIDNTFYDGSWATNEEMVDWIALQMPKIVKACEEVGALWDY